MDSKRNISLWILYDYANSFVLIVFFMYFAQWLVVDRGMADIYYNLTYTVTAILLFLTVPFTGQLLDRTWRRISGLRYTTLLTGLFHALCAVFALYNKDILALISFTMGLYFYLLSFTFYTPLIKDISNEKNMGLISGLGIAANYLGQLSGLIVVLPFANSQWSIFGGNARAETLLPSVAVFLLLSIPTLLFFHEPKRKPLNIQPKTMIMETLKETNILLRYPSVVLFLLSYFFFNDGILTAANNFSIFMEQVWHLPDTTKTFVLLGILVTSAIGGIASGYVADRFGHKRTLMFILIGYLFILPAVGLMSEFMLFAIVTSFMGLWYGAVWTVSRSVMTYVAPKGKHNLAFAYFGLAERASSLLGPLVWGGVVSGFVSLGVIRYRIAPIVMTLFILLGIFALRKVKDDREEKINL